MQMVGENSLRQSEDWCESISQSETNWNRKWAPVFCAQANIEGLTSSCGKRSKEGRMGIAANKFLINPGSNCHVPTNHFY